MVISRAVSIALIIVVLLIAVVGIVLIIGARRWQAQTDELHRQLTEGRRGARGETYDRRMLGSLPVPVQSYLEKVLTPGQPIVSAVAIDHSGTFNMSDSSGEEARWRPFRSSQRVVIDRPGFVWDGRVAVAPGLRAHVHDAYVAGTGILHVALGGLITVADMRETPEIAAGELMRFLAEAAWYPTALLPSEGVTWMDVDAGSADATIVDGDTSVTLRFHFGADDLIERVTAAGRPRAIGGTTELTPWEGRFSGYEERAGMLVPTDGDVAWLLPHGRQSYWRGHIERVAYEFR